MPGKDETNVQEAALDMDEGSQGNHVSVRATALPSLADVRKEDAPGYDDLINFPRARDKEQVQCVMCGRRPGGAVVIPRQNKDVCRECDRVVWMHERSCVHFKWCKGCKRFLNLFRFGDKVEAAKCERCRQRGRQSYLAKKVKTSPTSATPSRATSPKREEDTGDSADPDGSQQMAPEKRRGSGRRGGRVGRSGSQGMATEHRPPLKLSIKLGKLKHLVAATTATRTTESEAQPLQRQRSLSEGAWLDGRPVVFKSFAGALPGSGRAKKSAGAVGAVRPPRRDSPPTPSGLDVQRDRILSHTLGSPLEAFSEICDDQTGKAVARPAKRRKRALSVGSFDETSEDDTTSLFATNNAHGGRGRTNSVHELAQVAASMYVADFARDLKLATAPLSALSASACDVVTQSEGKMAFDVQCNGHGHGEDGKDVCPALYELASVHTRIMKLEEDAQRVPGLLKKLSTQSMDLLHWRSECERLESELDQRRGEASEMSRELRELRSEVANLRKDESAEGPAPRHPTDLAMEEGVDLSIADDTGSSLAPDAAVEQSEQANGVALSPASSGDGLAARRPRQFGAAKLESDPSASEEGKGDGTSVSPALEMASPSGEGNSVPSRPEESRNGAPAHGARIDSDGERDTKCLAAIVTPGPVPTFGRTAAAHGNSVQDSEASAARSSISPGYLAVEKVPR